MKPICAYAIVSFTSFIVYYNTLSAEFVYDDHKAIVTNGDVLGKWPISAVFHNDFWGTPLSHLGSHKSYRPLTTLTFRLNHVVHGLDAYGYHLCNVIAHCVASSLVLQLMRRLFDHRPEISLFGGLFFAVHPVHCEAVAGVVGRADVLATIAFLLGIIATVEKRINTFQSTWMVIFCAGIGMLFKEPALMLLPVAFTAELLERKLNRRRALIFAFSGIFLSLCRLWLIDFKSPQFSSSDNPAAHSQLFLTRTLTFAYLPVFHFALLLFPHQMCFDWSMDAIPLVETLFDKRVFSTFVFYVAFIALICCNVRKIWQLRKIDTTNSAIPQMPKQRSPSPKFDLNANLIVRHRKGNRCEIRQKHLQHVERQHSSENPSQTISVKSCRLVFATSIIAITHLPVSNIFAYVGFVAAERILYLPSVGYCIVVAIGFEWMLATKSKQYRKAVMFIAFLCVLLFSVKTIRRNCDWQNEEQLYRSALSINPAKAYGNLGNVYARQHRNDDAIIAYNRALQHRPNMADVHYNVGVLYQEIGQLEMAIERYEAAIKHRQTLAPAYLNLGLSYWSTGNLPKAKLMLEKCGMLDGNRLKDPRSHNDSKALCLYNLGRIFASENDHRKALISYQMALQLIANGHDSTCSILNMMGEAELHLGNQNSAEKYFENALNMKPDHLPAHFTMAQLRLKQERYGDAWHWLTKAHDLQPLNAAVHQNLGQFHVAANDFELALQAYLHSYQLDKTNADTVLALANVYRRTQQNAQAEEYYRILVQLRPDQLAYANYGAILHLNGKRDAALSMYQKALEMRHDDEITKENMNKLNRIKQNEKNSVFRYPGNGIFAENCPRKNCSEH